MRVWVGMVCGAGRGGLEVCGAGAGKISQTREGAGRVEILRVRGGSGQKIFNPDSNGNRR